MALKNKVFIGLLVVVLMSLLAEAARDCTPRRLSPKRKFKHLRQHYHFVEKVEVFEAAKVSQVPRRTRRSASLSGTGSNIAGSSLCPWRWETDDDSSRSPRYFQKADCPGCAHYCRAVYYHHRALFRTCDSTTGIRVWKWIDIALPVAYLYDP